ncbi:sugar O-acyltransferase (sialic acid O-acetyltransferase NeuD family) [Amorphus suaedae]
MASSKGVPQIVVLGAGPHAKVVLEAAIAADLGEFVGLLDPAADARPILGIPVLGSDELLPELRARGIDTVILAVGHNAARERLGREAKRHGYQLPPVVHPSAFLAPSAQIAEGAVVMARAVVGTDVSVGDFSIVNTGAIIDHDGVLQSAAHVAPGCAIAGSVRIGARTLIGVGSSIRPGTRIGMDVVVGAGSAVVCDIDAGFIVGGAPARPLRAMKE